ncbi:adenylate/guanylate cyclase domain-containing protein [Bradyrhizobium jicamae]|nr:adenylate/guanylate cyclase domain-containing protein [Bradyrhizobium jicamae]MBR0939396.1 adenylate/guanylate cyclase domain-containing protein [Bradyrhizobium jicamae]
MKRKIAAILAADVVGYSRLMAEDEEETMRRLVSYRAVFDDFVTRADGRIFNTAGDAVLAEFPSAVDALRAAIDIQESLRTRNLGYPPSRHMVFRIGLTIGDVMEREGDLLGDGVNVAARLQGLATPGGVCISNSVHDQVVNKLSVFFSDLGPQEVKNIPRPVHAYRVEFEKRSSEKAVNADPAAHAETISRHRSAEVLATLPLDDSERQKQWRSPTTLDDDVPRAHASARSSRKVATAIAACVIFLVAASGVGWLWVSSKPQIAVTLPLSEANLVKILEPAVNADNRTDQVREYPNTKPHRALVIAPTAKVAIRTAGWSTKELAVERNIERCSQYFNEACAVIGSDDIIFVPRASEGWPLHDAPRVHYAGIFNPERIPALRESELLRPDIAAYATLTGPKAAAFHALGILVLKTNAPDQRSAEASALAECNANPARSPKTLGGPCYLYAVGNQVVLPLRSTQPMTAAAPPVLDFAAGLTSILEKEVPKESPQSRKETVAAFSALPVHRAMAIAPRARAHWRTGDWPSRQIAEEKVLERCSQFFDEPCAIIATDDSLGSPKADGVWITRDAPKVRYSGPFNPEQIPGLRDQQLQRPEVTGYANFTGPKAAAIHAEGIFTVVRGTTNQRAAEEQALNDCNANPDRKRSGGRPCFLYSIENRVVFPLRLTSAQTVDIQSPQQTPAPGPAADPVSLQSALLAAMENIAPAMSEKIRVREGSFYVSSGRHKALAMHPPYDSWRIALLPNEKVAEQVALEACEIRYGDSCILLAVDDNIRPRASDGDWQKRPMPRVSYGGDFDPQQIPTLKDADRSRPDVASYRSTTGPKASALHPWGRIFVVTSSSSQFSAEARALSDCNEDPTREGRDGPCWLYSVGDQVVLPKRSRFPISAK